MKKIWIRDYRNFNNQEFLEEIGKTDWVTILAKTSAEEAFNAFYNVVNDILNVMAPAKLLNIKEIGILINPWLTKGILKSIYTRDKLHKAFITEPRSDIKEYLCKEYKSYRKLTACITKSKQEKLLH